MFYDRIHVGFIDWAEPHCKRFIVNLRHGNGDIIGLVEIGDNAACEILIGITVLIDHIIEDIERFELVVREILPVVVIGIEITHGNFPVLFVPEITFLTVLFRFLLEDGVPAVNLVKCLVKQILLVLTIDSVLLRNLVLVSHLHAQNTGKQVGSVAGLDCCCRLHNCWILCVRSSVT